jgi:hypothetical protein
MGLVEVLEEGTESRIWTQPSGSFANFLVGLARSEDYLGLFHAQTHNHNEANDDQNHSNNARAHNECLYRHNSNFPVR